MSEVRRNVSVNLPETTYIALSERAAADGSRSVGSLIRAMLAEKLLTDVRVGQGDASRFEAR